MLRFCRASTSTTAALRRPLLPAASSCRSASGSSNGGSPSDGLFPPATEPKADLAWADRRSTDPLADEPAVPGGLLEGGRTPALGGKRRLPALKGMQSGGALAKALAAGSSSGGSSGQEAKTVDEQLVEQQQVQQPTSPVRSALDALLPSSSSSAGAASRPSLPAGGPPSSVLNDILNSPALASSPSAGLSRSSPYLPSTALTSGPARAFLAGSPSARHQSIFTSLPTPPLTHTINVHLKVSRNNALATLAYAHSGAIVPGCEQISGGTVGFKKAAQGGFEAGHQVACAILRAIREENGRKLREKRDFRKVFYRARAEERRVELVEAFEGLKERQKLLADERKALEIEAPDFGADGAIPAVAAPKTPTPTTYAAAEPLDLASAEAADPKAVVSGTAAAGRSYLQRRAALGAAQRSLSEGLASYNSAVRLLSSELRDLQANKIPSDALLPRSAAATAGADVIQDQISAELKEAEEQAAGQAGVYFKVFIGGFGQGREAFLTALMGREGHFVRPLCTGLGDASHMKCVRLSSYASDCPRADHILLLPQARRPPCPPAAACLRPVPLSRRRSLSGLEPKQGEDRCAFSRPSKVRRTGLGE